MSLSPKEIADIRSKLRLRFNTLSNTHEVYTTIHGSGIFKWTACTDHVAEWYKLNFGLAVDSYVQVSMRSGGLMEIKNKPLPVVPLVAPTEPPEDLY